MRARWVRDEEEGWRKLPPRAWPPDQPKADEIPELRARLEAQRCPPAGSSEMSPACVKTAFDLATAQTFNGVEAQEGLTVFRRLASAGHVDGMVAAGICLVEGIGVARDEAEGLVLLQRASERGNAQGHFELGTLLYMGAAGVEEDEPAAFALYEKSAAQAHVSGMFMVGDCLLEGRGCDRNAARAVRLLYAAAEQGHRGARQYIRQLLDGVWPADGTPLPSGL